MDDELSLRPATTADCPLLAQLDAQSPGGGWSVAAFAEELRLSWSRVLVLERGADVLGFMVYWLVAGEVQLLDIATHPDERRRGLGSALMRRLIDEGRASGAERVVLEVRRGNAPARRLYERFGFRETGARAGYYQSDGDDAVLMELWLGSVDGAA